MNGSDKRGVGSAIFDGVCHVAVAWGAICGTFAAVAMIWAAISPAFGYPEHDGRAAQVIPYLTIGYLAVIIVLLRRIETQQSAPSGSARFGGRSQ